MITQLYRDICYHLTLLRAVEVEALLAQLQRLPPDFDMTSLLCVLICSPLKYQYYKEYHFVVVITKSNACGTTSIALTLM